jgi:hypothetical protein
MRGDLEGQAQSELLLREKSGNKAKKMAIAVEGIYSIQGVPREFHLLVRLLLCPPLSPIALP